MTSSQEHISPGTHPTDFCSSEPFTQKHRLGSTSKTWTNISYFWSTWATNCKAGERSWRTCWSRLLEKASGLGSLQRYRKGAALPSEIPAATTLPGREEQAVEQQQPLRSPRNSSSAGDAGWEKAVRAAAGSAPRPQGTGTFLTGSHLQALRNADFQSQAEYIIWA